MVVEIRYYDLIVLRHGAEMGTSQLVLLVATGTKLVQEFAVILEYTHTALLVVHHYNAPISVHHHAFGTEQFASAYFVEIFSLRAKYAHPHVIIDRYEVGSVLCVC